MKKDEKKKGKGPEIWKGRYKGKIKREEGRAGGGIEK